MVDGGTGRLAHSDDNFRFEIDREKSPFSQAELISSLEEYARVHKTDSFGMRDYDAWDGRIAAAATIQTRFGTWGKAMQAAGCRTVRGYKLDPVAMVDSFVECWRQQGSVPTHKQLDRYLEVHNLPFRTKSYGKVFGGVGRLAQRVVDRQNGVISNAELYRPQVRSPQRDRAVSLKMRHAVLKRDGYRCQKCGASPSHDESVRLEVDHIVPVSRDGKSTMDNLQTLCWECNQGKKDRGD